MTAIAPVATPGRATVLQNQTAQASTGQTDWFSVPAWAEYAYIDYNLTATAQHIPLVDVSLVVPALTTLDDTTGVVKALGNAGFVQLTAVARLLIQVGHNVTGIADSVTNSATGLSAISLNIALPPFMGVKVLNDRTAQSEVQTVTLSSFDAGDSFKLTKGGTETIAFVSGTNATAAAIQTETRSKWSDNGITVTGTTDAGPFVITFGTTVDESAVTVTSVVGCTGVVAETWKGGLIPTYTYSLTTAFR